MRVLLSGAALLTLGAANPPGPSDFAADARELDRLDMHIYDGAHFLLETHHRECAALMRQFILDVREG